MPEPAINVDRQWFDLKAKPDRIDTAATAWTTLGEVGDDAGTDLNKAAQKVYDDPWEGDVRNSYETHQKNLRDTCTDMVDAAKPIKNALTNIASALRSKQGDLTDLENEITGAVACGIGDAQITFRPKTPKESKKVTDAVETAKEIRGELDDTLSEEQGKLKNALTAWTDMSTDWQSVAEGGIEGPFQLPPEPKEGGDITLDDGTVIVNSGTGDDNVDVTTRPDGTVVVSVNGKETEYPPGSDIVLRTGAGDDNVNVSPLADTGTTVVSGDGNDSVDTGSGLLGGDNSHNVITGHGDDAVSLNNGDNRVATGGGDDSVRLGGGDNHVATGGGDDNVARQSWMSGGTGGDNTISSGRGNDNVEGGSGNDRIYAGEGDDTVRAGGGDDMIFAGDGDDALYGQSGDDAIYGGDGRDYVDGGDGADRVYGGEGDDVLYGMNGDDHMHGGTGDDYMEGAKGDDAIVGGDGDDMLSGGKGDDAIQGGQGDDVMYGGHGSDYVNGGEGDDAAYIQADDTTSSETEGSEEVEIADHDFIEVEDGASSEFSDRVEADLDMLASSPRGAEMINGLHDNRDPNYWGGEHSLTIQETDEGNSANSGDESIWGNKSSEVNYNPSRTEAWDERPPVVGLHHELAHVHTYWDGSYSGDEVQSGDDAGVKEAERQAVGLPFDGSDYNPDDPRAGLDLDYDLTENGLRDELGRPPRTSYS